MKSTKTAAILLFMTMFFLSCSKNMDHPDPLKVNLTNSPMEINYFFAGQDKTSSYTGYNFSFNERGELISDSGAGVYNGKWELVQKVAGPAININLAVPRVELQALNGQWDVVNSTATGFELKQGSAVLKFQKN